MTFSDENNPIFPSAQVLPIKTGTIYVVLTCGLSECVWMTSNDSDVIRIHSYIIANIPDSYSETFSLMRMSSNGVNYSTAHVHIHAQVITQSPTSTISPLVAIAIVLLIFIIILAAISIPIPLFIFFYMKKRNTMERLKLSVIDIKEFHLYENAPRPNSSTKKHLNFPVTSNPRYTTIDEASMIPLRTMNEHKQSGYQNIVFESTCTRTYEETNETNGIPNNELNPITPHDGYIPMSSLKVEKKFVPKFILIKEFPATYQQYITSGIGKDSLFHAEFTNLNEDARISGILETEEAES